MRSMRTVLILRAILAVIVGTLAVVALANGRVVIGLLLAAFAITNTVLIVTIARRRAELAQRFPSAAARGRPPA